MSRTQWASQFSKLDYTLRVAAGFLDYIKEQIAKSVLKIPMEVMYSLVVECDFLTMRQYIATFNPTVLAKVYLIII